MIKAHALNDADTPVVLAEWETRGDRRIGVVTLNVPKTLNSLTLEMIDLLDAQLRAWADDTAVVAVYLRGAGERAFCAGGDIQALYRSMSANHDAGALVDHYAEQFFEREYRLDHLIHRYPRPLICFGHGMVMGGGLGLLSASAHRVVTETSRVAMPEITIGLFPDAGGTALLTGMPGGLGLFLGLTGAQINGADALAAGLGQHLIAADQREPLEAALVAGNWSGERHRDDALVASLLSELADASVSAVPESRIAPHRDAIDAVLADVSGDYARAVAGVRSLKGRGDWIDRGLANLERGCPVTAGIVVEQLHRGAAMSLADKFRMEMVIGTHCARHPDFAEGVRALLIDKDAAPVWSHGDLDTLPRALVEAHFAPPWARNPLDDLED